MITDKHHDPALEARLRPLVTSDGLRDTTALTDCLSRLSVREFRTAGYLLGERLLPELSPEDFWVCADSLISFNSKAFLITVMKSYNERMRAGNAAFAEPGFLELCKRLNGIEAQKVASFLLPLLPHPDDVAQLFTQLRIEQGRERINYLVRFDTLPCAFELLRSLRFVEHDTDLVMNVARFLIKHGTTQSFNLASLMKVMFGLEALRGTFSLSLAPFQIARIESSYSAFCEAMTF